MISLYNELVPIFFDTHKHIAMSFYRSNLDDKPLMHHIYYSNHVKLLRFGRVPLIATYRVREKLSC